ncbi:MAG: FG-GAP repeat protein, partial [Phycisphaerales bacterium]|nr:FG-GAP repeat protein [Phycisphaerales bacterium]
SALLKIEGRFWGGWQYSVGMAGLPPYSTALALSVVFASTSPLMAQCLEDAVGLPENSEPAIFGTAVVLQGDLVVVGAPLQAGLADWAAGRVHVFRLTDDGFVSESELVADDGAVGDLLGVSVATDGSRIIAGAFMDDAAFINDGSAYVYRLDTRNKKQWVQEAKLVASAPQPQATFGRTVAIDGDLAVVGAPLDGTVGSASGRVHIFERDGSGAWFETAQLTSPGQQPGDRFGLALDLDGDQLAVGASWAGSERGEVHIYERSAGGAWNHVAEVLNPSGVAGDQFGFDVALDGDRLLVGEYHADGLLTDSGAVHFFSRTAGVWTLEESFSGDALGASAEFGVSVDLQGDVAVAGSQLGTVPGGTPSTGTVEVYGRVGGQWSSRAILAPEDTNAEAEFGWQLSIDGNRGVIGSPYASSPVDDTGMVYLVDGLASGCGPNPDLNGDGVVDGADMGLMLSMWGPCPDPSDCPADLNGDGIVGGGDIGLLLAGWS